MEGYLEKATKKMKSSHILANQENLLEIFLDTNDVEFVRIA